MMARRRTSESSRQPVGFGEGYRGRPLPPGVKLVPVKCPAADVPVKRDKSDK